MEYEIELDGARYRGPVDPEATLRVVEHVIAQNRLILQALLAPALFETQTCARIPSTSTASRGRPAGNETSASGNSDSKATPPTARLQAAPKASRRGGRRSAPE